MSDNNIDSEYAVVLLSSMSKIEVTMRSMNLKNITVTESFGILFDTYVDCVSSLENLERLDDDTKKKTSKFLNEILSLVKKGLEDLTLNSTTAESFSKLSGLYKKMFNRFKEMQNGSKADIVVA